MKKETLCWSCQNARCDMCSWFEDYTPVENWEAIKTKVKHGLNRFDDSYCVLKCPNFKRDKKQKTKSELAKELQQQDQRIEQLKHDLAVRDRALELAFKSVRVEYDGYCYFEFNGSELYWTTDTTKLMEACLNQARKELEDAINND